MSTQKTEREYRAIAEEEGLRVTRIVYGKKMKVYVSAPGVEGEQFVSASRSPSDVRALMNIRQTFKKLLRSMTGGDHTTEK